MKIGYARVSTRDQNLDLQMYALNNFGCEQIENLSNKHKNAYDALHFIAENNKKSGEDKQLVIDIAKILGISNATFYRYLDWAKQQNDESYNKKRHK